MHRDWASKPKSCGCKAASGGLSPKDLPVELGQSFLARAQLYYWEVLGPQFSIIPFYWLESIGIPLLDYYNL